MSPLKHPVLEIYAVKCSNLASEKILLMTSSQSYFLQFDEAPPDTQT